MPGPSNNPSDPSFGRSLDGTPPGFDAHLDEDNGYAKPAGPMWSLVGRMLGLVIAVALCWFLVGHRDQLHADHSMPNSEAPSNLNLHFKGMALPTSTNYVYRIVGPKGAVVDISYLTRGGATVQLHNVALPWSVASTSPSAPGTYQAPFVVANGAAHNVLDMTCESYIDGTFADEETAQGSDSGVLCRG